MSHSFTLQLLSVNRIEYMLGPDVKYDLSKPIIFIIVLEVGLIPA
jgi:hypothetical protein